MNPERGAPLFFLSCGADAPSGAGRCAAGRREDEALSLSERAKGAACGRGRGNAPLCGAGNEPPFSFRLRRKENGRSRSKEKAHWCPNPALWAGLDKYGGRARQCFRQPEVSCRVRLSLVEQGGCFPAFEGWGEAFEVVAEFGTLLAPRVPLRYALPGGKWSGSGKRSRPNRFCSPTHGSSSSRAVRLQVSVRPCPRPTLRPKVFCAVSCWDPSF